MSKNIILHNWIQEFAQMLAVETLKLTSNVPKQDKGLIQQVRAKFVKYYIEKIVYDLLTEHIKATDKQKAMETTHTNLKNFKHDLQAAVCEGFEKAFAKFSNMHVEYYCIIAPVPEPKNKLSC